MTVAGRSPVARLLHLAALSAAILCAESCGDSSPAPTSPPTSPSPQPAAQALEVFRRARHAEALGVDERIRTPRINSPARHVIVGLLVRLGW